MVSIGANAESPTSTKSSCGSANGKPKEKRRNNEKRKEKSRDAARFRRSRETEIFSELALVLPLKKEDITQLDKASVMRIAIANLKIRGMLDLFPKIQQLTTYIKSDTDVAKDSTDAICTEVETETEDNNGSTFDLFKCAEATQLLKQTLDGFLIILSNDGDITYVSDNITEYLGIAKIDILGQQIWEYSHQCDHVELEEALNIKRNGILDKIKDENLLEEGLSTDHRDFFVRLKCTLTSRGRSINIKSASYKVIHITGHLVVNTKGERVLIAIGRPIPHPSNIEIPLGSTTFLTKHSLDMKFTYVDDKMLKLFGYESEDLLGKSMYGCYHGADSDSLMGTFKTVLSKGQGETCRYRFLGKHGGYCWIVTQATIVYDKLKPQSVVCVNYVISNLENNNEIYSLAQYEASKKKLEEISNKNNNSNKNNKNNNCKDEIQNTIETTATATATTTTTTSTATTTESTTNATIITKQELEQTTISSKNQNQNQIHTQINANNCNNQENNLITISKTKIENNSINPPQTKPQQQQQQRQQQSQTQNKTPQSLILSSVSPTLTSSINCINEPIQVNNIKSENIPILNTTPQQLPTSLIDNKHIILRDQSINALNRNLDVNSLLIVNKSYKKEEKRPKSVTASVFKAAPITNSTFNHKPVNKQLQHQQHQQQQHQQFVAKINPKVQTATPTTQQKHQIQDMNKGFLSFAEDATELTMLKEEPDDLQQLATSGDVDACMPLDETTPLLSEMLDGFINSYLSDDINSLDSTTSSTTENTQATTTGTISSITVQNSNNNSNNSNNVSNKGTENIDPFINYREESNDTNCSQHLLSPSVTSKSPEANSLPSLCSPTSLSQEDDFAFMTMSGEDEIDLTTRAPYIPMDEQDNVPLLTDDLMWCSNNAFTADDFNIYKETDPMQQLHMQQQQQQCESNRNILGYQQHELTQQHFSNSLCSSPASTVSSLSPSPVNHHQHQHQQQQQQQQHDAVSVFGTDSSELAALLCGSGNGTLSILSNNCGSTDDNDGTNMSCNIGSSGGGGGGAMNNTRLTISPTQTQPQALTTINGNVSDNFRLHDIQQELLQEQRQQLLGLSIDCKKEKYENTLAPSLSDSIVDAFENIYSKDSTNLDCWNELLQINVNDPTSNASSATCSPVQHQHLENVLNTQDCKPLLHQQQQNIILNTVPLITIQSNKNIFLQQLQQQQQQQQQQQNDSIINELTAVGGNSNNTSSTDKMLINDELLAINRSSSKISTITLLNSAPRRPMTTTATIRVVDNKLQQHAQQLQQQLQRAQAANKTTIIQTITPQLPQQQQQQQQQPQQHGNKRHLTSAIATAQIETKRLRSGNANSANTTIIDLQATPQLLQQLMTPTQHTVTLKEQQKQQQQQQQTQRSKNATQRWSGNVGDSKPTATAIVQQQQSNSVLKNLLDGSSTKVEPMYIDENSADQEDLSPLGLSPDISKPLHCVTNIASILRNYRHNPMIGGPGVLPSPIFAQNDDSNPPGLTACDTDSASDSGIDDVSFSESGSPLKIQVDKSEEHNTNYENYTTHQMDPKQKDMLLMKCMKTNLIRSPAATPPPYSVNSAPPPLPPPQASQILNERASANIDTNLDSDISSCVQSRKNSISSLLDDANNPLNTPFLMELGNDDYNMTTEPYLETNDIEHVLNEWTHEMA